MQIELPDRFLRDPPQALHPSDSRLPKVPSETEAASPGLGLKCSPEMFSLNSLVLRKTIISSGLQFFEDAPHLPEAQGNLSAVLLTCVGVHKKVG